MLAMVRAFITREAKDVEVAQLGPRDAPHIPRA